MRLLGQGNSAMTDSDIDLGAKIILALDDIVNIKIESSFFSMHV